MLAVDARLSTPIEASALLAGLPPADRTYRYDPPELDSWGVVAPAGAVVDEVVWGVRGLAVVIVRAAGGDSVVRVRGFEPMDAARWIDGFVRFVAIPEH